MTTSRRRRGGRLAPRAPQARFEPRLLPLHLRILRLMGMWEPARHRAHRA